MLYGVLADSVMLVHFLFVAFVGLGGLVVLWWRRAAWLHLAAISWGVLVEFARLNCPLTPLENWLRHRAGRSTYDGGFIEHYIIPFLYPPAEVSMASGGMLVYLVLLLNALIYLLLLLRMRSERLVRLQQACPIGTGTANLSS